MVLRIISSASKAPPETKMFSYERLPSTTSALEKKHDLIKQEILIHKRVTASHVREEKAYNKDVRKWKRDVPVRVLNNANLTDDAIFN